MSATHTKGNNSKWNGKWDNIDETSLEIVNELIFLNDSFLDFVENLEILYDLLSHSALFKDNLTYDLRILNIEGSRMRKNHE